jgi:hypothetical protein
LFFFSARPQPARPQHDHSTTTAQHTPHHTTQQRKEVEFWTANPKKLKKWEIINSQDLEVKKKAAKERS